ncbi:MAG: hypothetical protein DLM69_11740 [Candidatus Chloroheliales bacterium]|nr:MAG: hypothetical protein DLM69_11740 [Chloroflexota bacterium]
MSYLEKTLRPYTIVDPEELEEMEDAGAIPQGAAAEYTTDPKIDRWYISNDLPDPGWMLVSHLPAEYVPEAVVTPDGVWHADEKLAHFADARDPAWITKYRQLLRDYHEHLAVSAGGHF